MDLRIGAVSYLNTKPLIHGLSERLPHARLVLDLPSRLADRLACRDLDVALIPSVEFLRSTQWSIVSDACIACHGPVRSVRMLFRKEPSQIRSLALDEGSRTSAVLAQVLLKQRFGIRPPVRSLDIHADFRKADADAILVIGDRAMQVVQSDYHSVWDLGEQWNQDTGLPFVFAMWVSSRPTIPTEVVKAFQDCRDQGLIDLDTIVAEQAAAYGLTPTDCKDYFTKQLYFYLGRRELAGLDLFRRQASQLGLIPASCTQLSLQPT